MASPYVSRGDFNFMGDGSSDTIYYARYPFMVSLPVVPYKDMDADNESARLGCNFSMHHLVALVHCACQAGLGTIQLGRQNPN